MLQERADALNDRGFDAVRFIGRGTDLTIGLNPAARWCCATFETAHGISHIPNMPTEEVSRRRTGAEPTGSSDPPSPS